MDRVVAARKLVQELVKGAQIEVRRVDPVARELATYVESLNRAPSGRELGDWLADHSQVKELYAGENVLEELAERHLAPPPSAIEAADVRHPDLERRVVERPDDAVGYQIYADWLQEQGDPFGELIALGIADPNSERLVRFRETNHARLFPGLTKDQVRRVQLHWQHGVVRAIEEVAERGGVLGPVEWDKLLRARACTFVQSIELLQTCHAALDDAIASNAPPTLTELVLYAGGGPMPERLCSLPLRSLALSGKKVSLEHDLPATLEKLELDIDLLDVRTPLELDIRELHTTLSSSVSAQLGIAKLPKLEKLVIVHPGAEIAAQLGGLRVPAHLELRDGRLEASVFAHLAKQAFCARLTALSLIGLELNDAAAAELAKLPLPKLATLDVSANELTKAGLAALEALAPIVISKVQYRAGNAREKKIRAFAASRLHVAEEIAVARNWYQRAIDGTMLWGRYSATERYETFVESDLSRYGCSCPSSVRPCKHVVALLLMHERQSFAKAPAGDLMTGLTIYTT